MFRFVVDRMADDCWDVFVSEDDGYTWEYYESYASEAEAREDAQRAVFESMLQEDD